MAPARWAIRRLALEHRMMTEEPTPGINVVPRPDNDRHLDVEMAGSMQSPYQGGVFRLEMVIPDDYPESPPKVRFLTKVYHPNIDEKGRICLDVLDDGESWSAVWNIRTILLSIQALLGTPNLDDPLSPSIGKRWRENKSFAIETAQAWTRLYAKPTDPTESEEKTPTEDTTTQTGEKSPTKMDEPLGLSARALAERPLVVAPRHPVFQKEHFQHTFEYASLGRANEIRILRLHPGMPSDPLAATIQHIVLPSYYSREQEPQEQQPLPDSPRAPSYEALSYAWGRPEVAGGIYLHSQDSDPGTQALGLTENCALALRRLRLPDKQRLIWVDAICINQGDVLERSAQVRIMHHIYKTAFRVLIYLGEGNDATDQAIDILQDDADGRRQYVTDTLDEAEENNLVAFFSLPWFKRVWILQEVAWATTALAFCGPQVVPWQTLHNAYMSSIGCIDRLQPLPHVLSFGKPLRETPVTPAGLLARLKNARMCDASDPRDKIYAVLGLFGILAEDPRLAIDYERGVSDLYTDVTEYLLESGLHLGAEMHNEPSGVPGLVLPTWVINWAAPPCPTYRFHWCFASGAYNRRNTFLYGPHGKTAKSPFPYQFVLEPARRSRLDHGPTFKGHLSSKLVPRVLRWISSPGEPRQFLGVIPAIDTPRRGLKVRAALLHTVGTSSRNFEFPRLPSTNLMSSACIEDWGSPENIPAFEKLMNDMDSTPTWIPIGDNFLKPAPPNMSDNRWRWSPETKFLQQALLKMRNRKIFTTESGLPAMGPLHVQGSDQIFAVLGERMCHILRRTDQPGVFTYVGDCFLYRHMRLAGETHLLKARQAIRYDGVDDCEGEVVAWEDVVIV